MRTVIRRPVATVPAALLAALLGLLLVLVAPSPAKAADSGLSAAASALKSGKVYVDPAMTGRFSEAQAAALTQKIKDADKPIFVAVIPPTAAYAPRTVITDLRTKVGIVGVYAVWRGNDFKTYSDPAALSQVAADRIAGAALRSDQGDINATVNDFVDQAKGQTRGHGVSGSSGAMSIVVIVVVVVLLLLVVLGLVLLFRRAKKRKENNERAQLEKLRTVVDEDLTAFGEELSRLEFNPGAPDADDAQRTDYTYALDAYDRAKKAMDAAKRPEDVQQVTTALEEGRFALATLAARREGRPLPERRPPCFFDPRHGPSVQDIQWAPAGGAPRAVPACADDAQRMASGLDPQIRHVQTDQGYQPYWDAGPAYRPWAGGYFGSGLLPGLVIGTVLGSVLASPGEAWGYDGGYGGYEGGYEHHGFGGGGYGGGVEGGDYSGADFQPDPFSGFSDSGGGDFGGGDSGGGDWSF